MDAPIKRLFMRIILFFFIFVSGVRSAEILDYNLIFDVSPKGQKFLKIADHYSQYKGEEDRKAHLKYPVRIPEIKSTIFVEQKQAVCFDKNNPINPYTTLFTLYLRPCMGIAVESQNKCALIHVDSGVDFSFVGKFIKNNFFEEKSVHIHVNCVSFLKEKLKKATHNVYESQSARVSHLVNVIQESLPSFRCSVSIYKDKGVGMNCGATLGISKQGVFHGDPFLLGLFGFQKPGRDNLNVLKKDRDKEKKELEVILSNILLMDDFLGIHNSDNRKIYFDALEQQLVKCHGVKTITSFPLDEIDIQKIADNIDIMPNLYPITHWETDFDETFVTQSIGEFTKTLAFLLWLQRYVDNSL